MTYASGTSQAYPVQSTYVSVPTLSAYFDPATETLDCPRLRDLQLLRVQELFDEILPRNEFYVRKFGERMANRVSWLHA